MNWAHWWKWSARLWRKRYLRLLKDQEYTWDYIVKTIEERGKQKLSKKY